MPGELGDRLTGAKLIIDALSDEKIDAEQAERLLDGLIPPANQLQTPISPERPLESPLTALDALDDAEYQEQRSIPRDERQDAVDEELARLAAPVSPVGAGENLLEDPGTFVARVEQAKARRLQQGTSHR